MSVDELWALQETISRTLAARIELRNASLRIGCATSTGPSCSDRAKLADPIQRSCPNFKPRGAFTNLGRSWKETAMVQ